MYLVYSYNTHAALGKEVILWQNIVTQASSFGPEQ